jgi:hypothetical protein
MWIESHQSLARHPKLKRLARELEVSEPTAIGHLHLLWWYALDYAPTGDLTDVDENDLADAILWTGTPQTILAALTTAGFLDRDSAGGELLIHDWPDYAGAIMARRSGNRKRQQALRDRRAAAEPANALYNGRPDLPDRTGPTGPDQPIPIRRLGQNNAS